MTGTAVAVQFGGLHTEGVRGKPFYAGLVGGLARYRKSAAHGPFVHVDGRGFHARWGD